MEQAAGSDPLIGAKVGNYEVRTKIGEGGMGSVYLAEHPLIGKKVALKVLHSEFAANQDVVLRFFTEAKAVNDIQHPNIVDIIDYGTLVQPDGHTMVYFIMEFLDGVSLAQLIRREAPLAPDRALRICTQMADALGASHQSNIVHRDLKPDNVILIQRRHEQDFVKVLDFGIAKLTGDQPGSHRTRTGIVMGTPAYMSPEQCEGRGEVDQRTDIYALGVLLYEMLTARVPFEGEGYGEVLVQHLTQPPVRPTTLLSAIPPHVESVCLRALEKQADARYPSMAEFIRALSDPVGYVDAAGGPAYFTTANLGAPQATPYPAAALTPFTPLPGQLSPVIPTPMPYQPSWPTPSGVRPAPARPKWLLIAITAFFAIGIGVLAAVITGGDDAAPVVAAKRDAAPPDAAKAVVTKTQPIDAGVLAVPIDAPAPPAMVTITINSSPKGASVYRVGRSKRLGKTPFDWPVEKSEKVIKLVLKRRGYRDHRFEVDLSINDKLNLRMVKERRSGGGSGKTGGSGSSKDPDGTMNPFD